MRSFKDGEFYFAMINGCHTVAQCDIYEDGSGMSFQIVACDEPLDLEDFDFIGGIVPFPEDFPVEIE
jgi:hypothetical protein